MDPPEPPRTATEPGRHRRGGPHLHAGRDGPVLRRGRGAVLHRERPEDGGLLRAGNRDAVHSHLVPGLPPHGCGRCGHRPLNSGRTLRHSCPGRRHGAAEAPAQDHHLHRDDVQLVQRRPQALLPRDEVAEFLSLRGQATGASPEGAGAVPPCRASHQRQRSSGPAGEVGARSGHTHPHRHAGEAGADERRAGLRSAGCRAGWRTTHQRAARRGSGHRRFPARREAHRKGLPACAARTSASVAHAHQQYRRWCQHGRGGGRRGGHPLSGTGRLDASDARRLRPGDVRCVPAPAGPLQARRDRRAGQRPTFHQ